MALVPDPTLLTGIRRMTCPVIIVRHGGLDGVALQKEEYRALLNTLGIHLHVVCGREDSRFGSATKEGQLCSIVPELDLFHPDTRRLYGNAFKSGPEKEKVKPLSRAQWGSLFLLHKERIRNKIERILRNVPGNTPVFIYNILSLRHLHPAAALAVKELVEKYPRRGFLSHSADPDAERPDRIASLKGYVLERISAHAPDRPYSGGPYHLDNLYHIVLNPTQRKNFIHRWGLPRDHVIELPDFLEFPDEKAEVRQRPSPGFFELLARNCVCPRGRTYGYQRKDLGKETLFFLSPVRPVARKRLKEAMVVARQYGAYRKAAVAFVVTHPDMDDRRYFLETVRFADALGLTYIHLGRTFSTGNLNEIYADLAALKTVGVVASNAGGWENALNEMATWCIPFFMNKRLNSFAPMTRRIGIRTYGMDFDFLETLVKRHPEQEALLERLPDEGMLRPLFQWIDAALDPSSRRLLVEHNFRQAYRHLSSRATAIKLWRLVWSIHARHTLA